MLYEISRRSIPISGNEEPCLTWHNNVLAVRLEKGIQLLDFTYNLQCRTKNIDLTASFIPNCILSPATGMFPKGFLTNVMKNLDLTQMIMEPGLHPHNTLLQQEMASVVAFCWSPAGVMHNNECAFAILNNFGNVQIYGRHKLGWSCALDLSTVIKERYLPSKVTATDLQEIKKAVDIVETSAIHWGPKVECNSCYFVTAQRNCNIIFWLLETYGKDMKPELHGEIQAEIGEILSMLWISKSDNDFLLICSNSIGQIFALDCLCVNNNIKLIKTTCLWTHKDRMIAKYLKYTIEKEKIILIFNKHRHLIVQMMDMCGNILSQVVNNVDDYRIADISSTKDGFYLITVNCKIYKINFNILNDNLVVNISNLETKDSYSTYEFYNFDFSTNNALCVIAMIDKQVKVRKEPQRMDIVFLCADAQHGSEMSVLLSNPSKKLTNYWDYVELLRYKTMKLKALPPIDFVQLYINGNTDIYKLKLYLILVKLYNTLEIVKNGSRGLLPETKLEVVMENIFVAQATKFINDVYNASLKHEPSYFDLECFIGAKKYLQLFCQKNNRHLTEFTTSDVLNLTDMDTEYTCQCCDEKIKGLSCKNGHLNMFCSLTFTPIINDNYLTCKGCGCTARIELLCNSPICLFCDLYLNNYSVI